MTTSTLDLDCCQWRSQHIRAYCQVLARCTDPLACELFALPGLHTTEEDSPVGAALWVAYNVAVGLSDVAARAVEVAMERWPEDRRLREMRDLIFAYESRLWSDAKSSK